MANPLRLLNFVPESEAVEEPKNLRVIPDRPLFEILKENKDKKDAEFNERFKHRPPKALDEDETEFLDLVQTHQREQERLMASEEARELMEFQAIIANRTYPTDEPNIGAAGKQDLSLPIGKYGANKRPPVRPKVPSAIKIVPQRKKAKVELKQTNPVEQLKSVVEPEVDMQGSRTGPENGTLVGLVSYSDESDDES